MKLDGGGSSTLFLAGRGTVNRPSDGHPAPSPRTSASSSAAFLHRRALRCRDGCAPSS